MDIIYTNRFKRDYKLIKKQGKNIKKLEVIIEIILKNEEIPARYKDHSLIGNYIPCRELHLEPDWLFVYYVDNNENKFYLVRTGSHSALFDGSYKLSKF